jgi:hypothetical protein
MRTIVPTLGLALCVALCSLGLGIVPAAATAQQHLRSRLEAGQRWMLATADEGSPSGQYELMLYTDGGMELDEVVHLASDPRGALAEFAAWDGVPQNVHRNCRHGYLTMQNNGNLVMYCRAGDPIWSTHTAGSGRHNHFQILNTDNLVVRTATGRTVWSAHSTAPMITTGQHLDPGQRLRTYEWGHRYITLAMRRTGDLVLTYGRRTIWHSGTHTSNSTLSLLRGGNVVVQGPRGRTLWSTHTAGAGAGTTLEVVDDGRIAEARLTGPHDRRLWSHSG